MSQHVPPKCEKWIADIGADDAVVEAARVSLHARLAAVAYYLPLAAERADEDIEYVHQLRVFTRRSMAALRLYRKVLRKKEVKWFGKTLRKIRRAAGAARDLDVLAAGHQNDQGKGARALLADVRQRRSDAQRPIIGICRKLQRKERLERQIQKLLKGKAKHAPHDSFGNWATARLRKAQRQFFRALPRDLRNLNSLHRFRIRGKQLRYAIELLAPAFSVELRNDIYPVVEQLQDRLGKIHDCAVAADRFRSWIEESKSKREAAYLEKLLEAQHETLADLLDDFACWWTPELQAKLRESFQRLVSHVSEERCNSKLTHW